MDMELYKKIIDECANHRNIERILLYMSNEPLLDPHLVDRVNYAKKKVPWACIHFLTNGLLLNEKNTKNILDSKLDWIGISFHGIRKETIEKSMGIPYELTLKRICNFIEEAKRVKDINEYVMITFLRHTYLNTEEKDEAIQFWRARGIKRISYFEGPISRAGNAKNLKKVHHSGKIVGCDSIWEEDMFNISEDGRVVLCCMDWRREVVLGDLKRQTIHEIWNGKGRDIWDMINGKKEMPSDFLCRNCEAARVEVGEHVATFG